MLEPKNYKMDDSQKDKSQECLLFNMASTSIISNGFNAKRMQFYPSIQVFQALKRNILFSYYRILVIGLGQSRPPKHPKSGFHTNRGEEV